MKPLNQLIADIASEHLGTTTLETRRSDRLDFHEVAVWQVKTALTAAFEAGAASVGQFDGFHIDRDSSDEDQLFVNVDGFTVLIKRETEGIVVDIYPLNAEGEPVASTYAFHSEASPPEDAER